MEAATPKGGNKERDKRRCFLELQSDLQERQAWLLLIPQDEARAGCPKNSWRLEPTVPTGAKSCGWESSDQNHKQTGSHFSPPPAFRLPASAPSWPNLKRCQPTKEECYAEIQPQTQENQVQSLGQKDPLKEDVATHANILAWRIPMERGTWKSAVHGVTQSRTQPSD